MILRLACLAVFSLCWCGALAAQTRVHTQTIKPAAPPAVTQPPGAGTSTAPAEPPKAGGQITPPDAAPPGAGPEIITDLSRLPPAVARTRTHILEAAATGDLEKLLIVMQSNETLPVFSFGAEKDPIAFWKANYPDSEGIEILAILVGILEAGFVHVDRGTPQERYVWPYFAEIPLKDLTPP